MIETFKPETAFIFTTKAVIKFEHSQKMRLEVSLFVLRVLVLIPTPNKAKTPCYARGFQTMGPEGLEPPTNRL